MKVIHTSIDILWLVFTIGYLSNQVISQDQIVYRELSSTANIPCGSTSKLFPPDAVLVFWYGGDNSKPILRYRFNDSSTRYYNDHFSSKYTCSSDSVLSISNVENNDGTNYTCTSFGASKSFNFIVELITLVFPSQPVLSGLVFEENQPTTVPCTVQSVKPGVGSVVFTVTVDPDVSIQSSDSDLSEGSANATTGAVSVTYSPHISLQRKYNGQQAVCGVVWSEGEKTVTSEGETVDVRFSATSITVSQLPSGLVLENTPITFTCLTDEANPTATVTWTVDGSSRSSTSDSTKDDGVYSAVKRQSVLTLTAEKELHDKKVQCVVSDNTGVNAEKTLNIAFSATSVMLTFSHTGPLSGNTDVTLTCTTDEANPIAVVVWSKDGVPVTPDPSDVSTESGQYNTEITISTLRVTADRTLNGAVYKCTVAGTNISKQHTMEVLFSATTVNLTASDTGLVTENRNVTFTCLSDEANPTANITWTTDGKSITSGITTYGEIEGMYNVQKRIGYLTVSTDRTLNGTEYTCQLASNASIKATSVLQIKYPPSVSVQSSANETEEGSTLVFNCSIEVGNPDMLISQYWEFEPKYPGSQSQALPEQRNNMELIINSTVYTDAGTYRCTAGNTVENDTGEIQIVVHYAPKFLGSDKQLVFYTGLNQNVTLNLTVHALPGLIGKYANFTWNKSGSNNTIMKEVLNSNVTDESFHCFLVIHSVAQMDYGNYSVIVDNGIKGPVAFMLHLKQRGYPEAPINVTITAVAAEQATVSWVVGLNGGSNQTFKVVLKNPSPEADTSFNTTFVDPLVGSLLKHSVYGLTPVTTYNLTVYSINLYNGSSETPSNELIVTTRAKPVITEKDLKVEITKTTATLSWVYEVPNNTYTTMVIKQCNNTNECIEHNVTYDTDQTLEVPVSQGDYFYFVIYLDGLQAYRSQNFTESFDVQTLKPDPPTEETNPSTIIIAVVLAIVAVVAILVILAVMFLRQRKKNRNKETRSDPIESHYEDTGMPLVPKRSNNARNELRLTDQDNNSNPTLPAKPVLPPILPGSDLAGKKRRKSSIENETNAPAVPKRTLGDNLKSAKIATKLPDYDNMDIIKSETTILQANFGSHFVKMVTEVQFKEEFDKLPHTPMSPWTVAAMPELKQKNRFQNMLPYDDNRIVLSEINGEPSSAYINASFIKGYNGNVSYIATIGCTKHSVNDFWRMMWEQNACVVVMVTNLKENGRSKCEKYWPAKGTNKDYGDISVKLDKVNVYPDYEVKHITMQKDTESRPVVHYHYTGWPDKNVPKTASAILKIREHVKQHRTDGKEPIVVHCSAGVGRTGTFISIDYLLDQVEAEGAVDVFNCAVKLRQQRFNMVQTVEQYRFVYQVINEAIAVGSTAIPCSELGQRLFSLTADGNLEREYQILQVTKPVFNDDDTEFATLFGNNRKNRYPDILPADENRVVLHSFVEDYINAVYVDGYKSNRSYIATQIPMDNTVATFWRMMMDERCAGIVCLQDDPDETKWFPKENNSMLCGPFIVTNTGGKRINGMLISAVTVGLAPETDGTYANVTKQGDLLPWDKDDKHNLKVFHTGDWTMKPVRMRAIPMLRNLYSEIQQWQKHCEKKRVTIMCLNGADESGLFIGASQLFDMANTEQEVDIFNLVKQIRLSRPQFISSADQYIFLHEAVQEYISQFGTYSNFK